MTNTTNQYENFLSEACAYRTRFEERFRKLRWFRALFHWNVLGRILRDAVEQELKLAGVAAENAAESRQLARELEMILSDDRVDADEVKRLKGMIHDLAAKGDRSEVIANTLGGAKAAPSTEPGGVA